MYFNALASRQDKVSVRVHLCSACANVRARAYAVCMHTLFAFAAHVRVRALSPSTCMHCVRVPTCVCVRMRAFGSVRYMRPNTCAACMHCTCMGAEERQIDNNYGSTLRGLREGPSSDLASSGLHAELAIIDQK